MSTKTIYKRIALVAVATLGAGVLSVAPASAATGGHANTITAASSTLGGTATAATATGAVGTAVTFTLTSTTTTPDAADTVILTPVLTGTAVVNAASAVSVLSTKTTVTATDNTTVAWGTPNATTGAVTGTLTAVAGAATVVYGFTPDVAGTYIYTISTTGTADVTSAAVTFTYTATSGVVFLGTGNNPAPTAASVTSGSSLIAVVGGFAKFTLAQGATSNLYNITATGMNISGVSTQLNRTVDTTQLYTNLNGTTVGGGVQWAPASIAGYITVTVTSLVTGTGTLTVQPINSSGVPGTAVTGTVTWGGAPTASAQYSLLTLNDNLGTNVVTGATGSAADTTRTRVTSSATATANAGMGALERFRIQIVTKDQNDFAISGLVLGASISGPGTLGLVANGTGATASAGRSLTAVNAGSTGAISVYSDGTSGVATITVTATNSAGVTTILGTKTVTFVGAPATATVTQNLKVAKAGTQLGLTPTTSRVTASSAATTPAFRASVVDANGVAVVAGSTVKMTSSDETVIVPGTCAEYTVTGTAGAAVPAPGTFECSVSGANAAVSGKTATITFSVLNAATGLYSIVAAPITFAIGGAIASTVVSVDKTSYAPGEAIVMVATAKDSAGNAAFDGQNPYATLATGNMSVGGAFPATTVFIVGGVHSTKSATGVNSLFAPASTGTLTVSGLTAATTAAPTGAAYSASVTIAAPANAEITALTTLVNSLIAKINALNKLVVKIQKKVRA